MDRTELEARLKTYNEDLEKICELQARTKDEAMDTENSMSKLRKRLADALASIALGEIDQAKANEIKAEMSRTEAVISDAPLIVDGLERRADDIRTAMKRLNGELSLIKARETFDSSKAEIEQLANDGRQFKSAAAKFRQSACTLNMNRAEVEDFIRSMDMVCEQRALGK